MKKQGLSVTLKLSIMTELVCLTVGEKRAACGLTGRRVNTEENELTRCSNYQTTVQTDAVHGMN